MAAPTIDLPRTKARADVRTSHGNASYRGKPRNGDGFEWIVRPDSIAQLSPTTVTPAPHGAALGQGACGGVVARALGVHLHDVGKRFERRRVHGMGSSSFACRKTANLAPLGAAADVILPLHLKQGCGFCEGFAWRKLEQFRLERPVSGALGPASAY